MVQKRLEIGGNNCAVLIVADTQAELEDTIAKGLLLRLIALGEISELPESYRAELAMDINEMHNYLRRRNERRNKQ